MKKTILTGCALLCLAALVPAAGCSKKTDLTEYVSEYRSDIFMGTEGDYSVFAAVSFREYPYIADGNAGETQQLFEVTLSVPDNTKTYSVSFSYGDISRQAELSFNSVMMVHTWSESLPAPSVSEIDFTVTCEEEETEPVTIKTASVKTEEVLPLGNLLECISEKESARFSALTTDRSFAGEIYVRLLCEADECFYYVGLTDRNGKTFSMLCDAESGEIIATKEQQQ